MAVAFKGGAVSVSSTTAGTTKTITYSPTAGNTLLVYGAGVGVDVLSVADNATGGSSTYTRRAGPSTNTDTGSIFGTAPGGIKSGVTTITVTFASSTRNACGCSEYTGVNAYGNAMNSTTGSSVSPGVAVVIQDANNLVVAGMSREGTSAWSTRSGAGTLRESLAGGGSTTPGVGIADNTSASIGSVTAGATISATGAWIASGIELRGVSPLASTISRQSTVSGTVKGVGVLVSIGSGHASLVSGIKGTGKLLSSFSRTASLSATGQATQIQAPSLIFASVSRQAQVASIPKGSGVLLGSVAGHASSSDVIKGAGRLIAPVVGRSTPSGTLKGLSHLVFSFSGHATTAGLLKGSALLSSSIVKQATVSSGGQSSTQLVGSFGGRSSLTGLLRGIGSIFSSIAHHASVGSVLQEFEAFGSAIFGRATVSGNLKAKGRLASLILGQHSIFAIPLFTVSVSAPLSAGIRGRSQVLCLPNFTFLVAPPSGVINSTTGQFKGTTVQMAFVGSNLGPTIQNDLIQVIGRGGKIIWRIDYQGNAEYNPLNYTAGAVLGRFFGNSIHDVLGLLAHQDLISVYNNGNCIWRVDSSGNVFRYTL